MWVVVAVYLRRCVVSCCTCVTPSYSPVLECVPLRASCSMDLLAVGRHCWHTPLLGWVAVKPR